MTERGAGRPERVAQRIREELAEMLVRGDVHDPDASGVCISSVRVTADLSLAHVGVRALEPDASEAKQKRVVAAMRRASGFLRKHIGGRLGIRQAPELRFSWDAGVDHAVRIEAILEEVRRDQAGAPGDDEGGTT